MVVIGILALSVAVTVFFSSAYAQSTDEQITLSGDLQNNPVAQDILEKIEKSKKWIETLQKRNSDYLEKQHELEEKRTEVLKYLQEDMKNWEEIWEYYTFDKMLERALANHPANFTDTIYDHPLKFTASKINAGRAALAQVVQNGGDPVEARDAFVNAAKITRAEMLSYNILYNVYYDNAYYDQQILFESDGQFDDVVSGDKLRKYYQDFRADPQYLQANMLDKISWEELGKNNPIAECRDGYVLVYRYHSDDYVCVTEYTAQMWTRHKMGEIIGQSIADVNPFDIETLERDRVVEKVSNLNSKITSIKEHYDSKVAETTLKYASLLADTRDEMRLAEKKTIERFTGGEISQQNVNQELTEIRDNYLLLEENITGEKSRVLELLEKQHQSDLNDFVKNYDSQMNFFWNTDSGKFILSDSYN